MAKTPPPSLRLKIDADALKANWRALDAISGTAKAGAAVKADCYGLGIDSCVPVLRDAGCENFFVAHWGEVEAVARHVPTSQISVLHGPLSGEDVAYARDFGAIPVIDSLYQAKLWIEGGGGLCHLMVDTGINRLGIAGSEIDNPIVQKLTIDTLMSHLACADEDSEMNQHQLTCFQELLPLVSHRRASLANSAGIALGSKYHFDLTRPGLSLYGGIPRKELSENITQVAFPEAVIIQTRTLKAGDAVGYNGIFVADKSMPTGVVSLGYADGFLRSRGGAESYLLHGEKRLPILGKVSMDMIVVDLSGATHLREGDWLEVPFSLPETAQHSGLSQYELLTTMGQRFERR
ncbi:Alanine racemase [Altererythrobacter insulae]|nr:Alanine racemase [Altererythrobacter insulae]